MGSKSRKSLRYDQKSLKEKGDFVVEIATSEEDVRTMLPGSCLVEVNSWKSEQVTGLYSIRANELSFLNYFPNWQKKAGFDSQ